MPSALRILVVDDRLETVSSLVDLLQVQKHIVDTTDNSMEALSLVGRKSSAGHPYHLVITDLTMPLLDGVGLARELRRRGERVAIAFISGYHSAASKIRTEAADLGILGLLGKPTSENEIQLLLARVSPPAQERLTGKFADPANEAFFGTARLNRPGSVNARPEEGGLARARLDSRDQAAPVDMDALLGRPSAPAAPAAPAPTTAPVAPVDEPVAPEFAEPAPESVANRRMRTPDPSAFYQPNGTLGSTTSFYKRTKTDPFLTSSGVVDPRAATPPPGTTRDPVTGNYRRQPSGLFPGDPNQLPTTTSRIRRDPSRSSTATSTPAPTDDAVSLTPPSQPTLPPASSITSGFRRSITGKTGQPPTTSRSQNQPPAPPTTSTCTVACAHCQGMFQVLVKPTAYTVLCVHCGQLNRIDPLPTK